MSPMAKERKATKPVKKHKYPIWGLRLPPALKEQLEKAAERNSRSPTQEVKVALEKYLSESGLWPPQRL